MATDARHTAAQAVARLHRGGWANLTLKSALATSALSQQDKAFAAALFYGTAERIATLDYLLRPWLKQPVAKLDTEVRALLETGLYQILYMDVPAHAAVNEAVGLARRMKKSSAAGLVNAVLRRAAEAGLPQGPYKNEEERVQVEYSVSPAVAKAVMSALPGQYDLFLTASFARPGLCLRANTLRTTPEKLAEALAQGGGEVKPGTLPACLYARLPGGVAEEEMFAAGLYHVQGEASQFACAALAVKPGERVLDLCAAPGGKSATLAQYLGGGEGLTACDIHAHRLQLVAETLARLGIQGAALLQMDAAVYNPALAGQDKVLCDVPCSGLGVLAAKPDLRYTAGENFAALPALQLAILQTAARYVKKGGLLVYSTCTIRQEENAEVVEAFLKSSPGFRPVLPKAQLAGAQQSGNMLTFLPVSSNLDGFFVATLERL